MRSKYGDAVRMKGLRIAPLRSGGAETLPLIRFGNTVRSGGGARRVLGACWAHRAHRHRQTFRGAVRR